MGLVTVLFAAYSPAKKAAKSISVAAVSGNANDLEPARNAANTQLLKIDTALELSCKSKSEKSVFDDKLICSQYYPFPFILCNS